MQIPVGTLRHTLALLSPVVPKRTPLPAAQYVLLAEGRAMANNLDVAAAVGLEGAEEALCLPPHLLGSFLGRVPGAALAILEQTKSSLLVKVDGQEATFDVPDPDDFPPFPHFEPEHEGVMDGDALVAALTELVHYTAGEETRPVLTAVCIELGDSPQAVAGDGFRLVWEPLPGKLPGESNLLFPRTSVKPLVHLWKHGGKQLDFTGARGISDIIVARRLMRLGWKGRLLSLNFGQVTMITQLVDGTFPNYKQLIPTEFTTHVTFLAEDLCRVLQGMAPVVRIGSDIVRLEWADRKLTASARGEKTGSITMVVPATCEGPGRIAFNVRYLVEYLNGKQGMVRLSVKRESAPALFTYRGKANHVLMPMFVEWDTPSPYPPEPPKEPDTDPVYYEEPPKADDQLDVPEDTGVVKVPEATEHEDPTAQVGTPPDNGHPEATAEKPKAKRARRKGAATA